MNPSQIDYPLISIAMATYNGGKYLEQQLDSIYAQTYPNIEVVVCDDGSQDQTHAILKRYQQEKGLRFYPNEQRLGFMKNFEKAMRLCQGEYIALSDQDDIWFENKLEYLYTHIDNNLLIHGNFSVINPENKLIIHSLRKEVFKHKYRNYFLTSENHYKYIMIKNSLVHGCTFLIHKELLKIALPIPDFEQAHDTWFAYVAASQKSIQYVDIPLTAWRVHGKNSSLQKNHPLFKKFNLVGTPIHRLYRKIRFYFSISFRFKETKKHYDERALLMKQRGYSIAQYPFSPLKEIWEDLTVPTSDPKVLSPYR